MNKTREELKILERESEIRAQISKSVNSASLVLEKHYREICRKHNIDDILNLNSENNKDNELFKDFDPKQNKPSTKKPADRRLKNPIWRAM